MELYTALKRGLAILIAMFATILIAEISNLEWFNWLAMILGGAVFLHGYWLFICFLSYIQENQVTLSFEDVDHFEESESLPITNEPNLQLPGTLAQNMRQRLSD